MRGVAAREPDSSGRIPEGRLSMPFKSQAQRRKFAELLVEGRISPETFEEWNRETGSKRLPEHAARKRRTAKKSTRRKKASPKRKKKATAGRRRR